MPRIVGYLTAPIETLHPGDWLLSRDEQSPDAPLVLRQIEATFKKTAYQLQLITLRSSTGQHQTLTTTAEHPLYALGQGWVAAGKLRPGALLDDLAGTSTVTACRLQNHLQGVDVFNFRIRESHTYFVRAEGSQAEPLWVHNTYAPTVAPSGGWVTREMRWTDLATRPNSYLPKELRNYIIRSGGQGVQETFGLQLAHPPTRPTALGFDYAEALPALKADHIGIQHRYLQVRRTGVTIGIPKNGTKGTGRLSLPRPGALP